MSKKPKIESEEQWLYKDAMGAVHGPIPASQMDAWVRALAA